MKKAVGNPSSPSRRSLLGAGVGTFALSLLGCGGDIGIAGIGSGGTGSFSSGPIRGFGSILLGDIHYDETGADLFDDAGHVMDASRLRLGMVVEVSGAPVTTTSTGERRAAAHTIAMRSEIKGPVTTIDAGNGRFVVLGQEIRVAPSTVFGGDLVGGLQALEPEQVVEVFGLIQDSGRYTATRVAPGRDQPAHYKLRGIISELDPSAQTLRIAGARISWAGVLPSGGQLAEGGFVRAELATQPDADGAWRALDIRVTAALTATLPGNGDEVELEGHVARVAPAGSTFVLLGMTVAYGSARFENGSASGLAPGVRVEVEGRMSADGTVLVASEVDLTPYDDEFDIEGMVTSVSPANLTFVVHGVTLDYSQARFADGTASDLVLGALVEVEARVAADGVTLMATEIQFDDEQEVELKGPVTAVSHAARTFVIQGVTVDYSQARFEDGVASELAPGVAIEAVGQMSRDGTVLLASEVKLDR